MFKIIWIFFQGQMFVIDPAHSRVLPYAFLDFHLKMWFKHCFNWDSGYIPTYK